MIGPRRAAGRRPGAAQTETILVVLGVAIAVLIAVTVFGRKIATLFASSAAQLDGHPADARSVTPADISDPGLDPVAGGATRPKAKPGRKAAASDPGSVLGAAIDSTGAADFAAPSDDPWERSPRAGAPPANPKGTLTKGSSPEKDTVLDAVEKATAKRAPPESKPGQPDSKPPTSPRGKQAGGGAGTGTLLDPLPREHLEDHTTFHPGIAPFGRGERRKVGRALETLPGYLTDGDLVFQRGAPRMGGSPATYDPDTGVIILFDDFMNVNTSDESRRRILAHELAHRYHHRSPAQIRDFARIGWDLPPGADVPVQTGHEMTPAALMPEGAPVARRDATFPSRQEGDDHARVSPAEDFSVSLELYLFDPGRLDPQRREWFDRFHQTLRQSPRSD